MNAPRAQKLKQNRMNAARAVSTVPDPELGSGAKLLACLHCRTVLLGFIEHLLRSTHVSRELMELAMAENAARTKDIRRLEAELATQASSADERIAHLQDQLQAFQAKAAAMHAALQARLSDPVAGPTPSPDELAAIHGCAVGCQCSVPKILAMIATSFAGRVVVLDSAHRSAEAAADFEHPQLAADLLITLATTYRDSLAAGRPDSEAKQAFGHTRYASGEAKLSRRGERLRTFMYQGEPVFMRRHLKLGVGEKTTTGLRIHFHWDAKRQVIVIGHCGAHLDFY